MAGDNVPLSLEIQADALTYLDEMMEKHDMPDRGKAICALLDYAIQDGDPEVIFGEIRCLRCED
jgi:hypothetical protein